MIVIPQGWGDAPEIIQGVLSVNSKFGISMPGREEEEKVKNDLIVW